MLRYRHPLSVDQVPARARSLRWVVAALCVFLAFPVYAKTRWSAVQLVPDADFLSGGQFSLGIPCFYGQDTNRLALFKPSVTAKIGLIEWVNVDVGWAGGFNFGFKARVLGETNKYLPSLAIGSHNILTHTELYFNDVDTKTHEKLSNEFFLVMGKAIEPIRLRLHVGIQSVFNSKHEQFNSYFVVEKYFGQGLYSTLEIYRRDLTFHPSAFLAWRVAGQRLEFFAGAIDFWKMFMDDNNNFEVTLSRPVTTDFVRPGFFFGIRYLGNFASGKSDGLMSIEDRLGSHQKKIDEQNDQIAALKEEIEKNKTAVGKLKLSVGELEDSASLKKDYVRALILDRIVALRTMYTAVPFEAEKVKQAVREITNYRDRAVPALKEIINDVKEDRHIRTLAISLLGDIGDAASSDILFQILSSPSDPGFKVEALISIGKMRETRALYLVQQLANDPDDGVAFTAQEVLRRLQSQQGVIVPKDTKFRKVTMPDSLSGRSASLGLKSTKALQSGTVKPDTALRAPAARDSLSKISKGVTDTPVPADTVSGNTGKGVDSLSAPVSGQPADSVGTLGEKSKLTIPAADTASTANSAPAQKKKPPKAKKPKSDPAAENGTW